MICFFNTCRQWGGGEKWHYDVAKSMCKNNEVVVVAGKNTELYNRGKKAGLKLVSLSNGNLSFLNPIKIAYCVFLFKKLKADTVILNLPADLKTGGIAAKLAGVKKIIYRRGSAIPIKNTFLNRVLFSRIITHVIANSNETKETIIQNNNKMIDLDKIKVIYNGVDCNEYLKKKYIKKERDEEVLVIGNVGRLVEQKGQSYLIDLAEELKKRGMKFKIIIGGSGPLEENLKRHAEEKGVKESIEFFGFVENVKDVMENIDIFALTSKWEGFGYVLVEAMLSEKPVIAFDISSNKELIINNENGYLVSPFDIMLLADKVIEMYKTKSKIKEMGNKGKEFAIERFDIKRVITELETIIHGE